MPEDHLLGVLMQFAECDEAAALLDRIRSRNPEALRIGVNAWVLLLHQDALLLPGLQIAGCAGVDALAALGIEKFRKAENDANQIERAALVVSLLHGRRNLVIRLSYYVIQP